MSYIKQESGGGSGDITGNGVAPRIAFYDGAKSITSDADFQIIPAESRMVLSGNGLRIPAGSETVPTLSITGDTNTGIFSPGADQISFTIAGSDALGVGANKNVTVGGASGTAGQVLTSAGPGGATVWANAAGGSGYRQVVSNIGGIQLPFLPSANPPTSYPVQTVGSTSISDDITFAPWIFRESITLRGIGFYAESGALTKPCALAIYESDANGLPSSKVANSDASVTPAISGAQIVTMAAGPSGLTLSAGFYWCALVNTTTGDIVNIRTHGNAGSVVGATVYNRTTLRITAGTLNSPPASLTGSTFQESFACALMFASRP